MNPQRILLKFLKFCSLGVGVNSQFLDNIETESIDSTTHRLFKIYQIFLNILAVGFMPFYYIYGVEYLDAYEDKPLLPLLSRLNVQLQCILVAIIILDKWKTSSGQQDLYRQLQKLKKYSVNQNLGLLFYVKYLCFASQGFVALLGIQYSTARRKQSWQDTVLILYCSVVHTVLHIYIFGFYCSLLRIINAQKEIEDNLRQICQYSTTFNYELEIEVRKYFEIENLCVALVQYFQFYIVSWFLTFLLINCVTVYIIFLMIRQTSPYSFWVLFAIFTIVFKFLDIFLLIVCCDLIKLKRLEFRQILVEQDQYSKKISNFFLKSSVYTFSFAVYGVVDLKKSLIFTIFANMVMQVVIVIQFDYILENN